MQNLKVLNVTTDYAAAKVRLLSTASVSMTLFAMIQVIKGAKLYYDANPEMNESARLLSVFADKVLDRIYTSTTDLEVDLTESNVRTLINYLTARIDHCTKERENESPNFHMDSYINMRMLLLDLRELIVPVVESRYNLKKTTDLS